jgi:hypothetical protein
MAAMIIIEWPASIPKVLGKERRRGKEAKRQRVVSSG